MRVRDLLIVGPLLLASTALARSPQHVGKRWDDVPERARTPRMQKRTSGPPAYGGNASSAGENIIPQTAKTEKFKVDGSAIPYVDFDVGESYAGLLPISDAANVSELYFWFYPSHNPDATDEILIWLNGGPGCSSLEGILQENGPFLWQYGTNHPVQNPYTWVNLTNVVWVEQPAGTGFSQMKGTPAATNEIEVAKQFLGFWKNFVDTFELHNRKVYITGESYAGYFVPYIADAMHNESNSEYFDVKGIQINDPSVSYGQLQGNVPVVPFVENWQGLFNLNDTYMDELRQRADECGYTAFMEEAMQFPPKGILPTPPGAAHKGGVEPKCQIYNDVWNAALEVNPCWDVYQVATTCPLLWDVLGFPGTYPYEGGPFIYFNLTDVQKAINAPVGTNWEECVDDVLDTDTSPPSGLSVLPRVIEKNERTTIAHGLLDMVLIMNGTVMMIQNMTWNGAQGFSTPPSDWHDFYVPYHSELNEDSWAGGGIFGNWWEERGLTFCTVILSGHMIPQYAPSAAYRQLEYLLGRIESLSEVSDFTTQRGDYGNNANATMYMMS